MTLLILRTGVSGPRPASRKCGSQPSSSSCVANPAAMSHLHHHFMWSHHRCHHPNPRYGLLAPTYSTLSFRNWLFTCFSSKSLLAYPRVGILPFYFWTKFHFYWGFIFIPYLAKIPGLKNHALVKSLPRICPLRSPFRGSPLGLVRSLIFRC